MAKTLRRPIITVETDGHVIFEPDEGGSERGYVDLDPVRIIVENSVNGDGSVRVALVFDCDFLITTPEDTGVEFTDGEAC